mmetsp:Transcript_28270/g.66982  ORF Transcript_28270/g.66982 Transcript_28270/m.66982 type:complete len:257 (+) Transcript_28270:106-876(+)
MIVLCFRSRAATRKSQSLPQMLRRMIVLCWLAAATRKLTTPVRWLSAAPTQPLPATNTLACSRIAEARWSVLVLAATHTEHRQSHQTSRKHREHRPSAAVACYLPAMDQPRPQRFASKSRLPSRSGRLGWWRQSYWDTGTTGWRRCCWPARCRRSSASSSRPPSPTLPKNATASSGRSFPNCRRSSPSTATSSKHPRCGGASALARVMICRPRASAWRSSPTARRQQDSITSTSRVTSTASVRRPRLSRRQCSGSL